MVRGTNTNRSRRRTFLKTVGVAAVAGLAGCSSGSPDSGDDSTPTATETASDAGSTQGTTTTSSSEPITVQYWNRFGGGDGDTMNNMVAEFNNQHDDIQIETQRLDFGTYYEKLYTSSASNEGPDIAIVNPNRLKSLEQVLTPIGEYMSSETSNAYISSTWEPTELNGQRLALPLATLAIGLYYNKNIFEDAGLDPENPPSDFESLQNAADAVISNTDKMAFNPAPYSVAVDFSRFLAGSIKQLGGQILTDDRTKVAFNNSGGVEVAQFLSDITDEYGWDIADASEQRGNKAFRSGDLAMTLNGTWYLGALQESDIEWGMSKPYVQPGGDQPGSWSTLQLLGVFRDANRSDRETEAAVRAAEWLTQNSVTWGVNAGHLPAYQEALESDELKNSTAWQKTLGTYSEMAQNDALSFWPATENPGRYNEVIQSKLSQVYAQQLSPQDAIDQAANEINSFL